MSEVIGELSSEMPEAGLVGRVGEGDLVDTHPGAVAEGTDLSGWRMAVRYPGVVSGSVVR